MRRAALFAFATLALACGKSPGVADQDLGQLVIAPKPKTLAIAVDRAAKDPAELSRALARPYRDMVKALGPHTYSLNTATTVDEAGAKVSDLSDHTTIEIGAGETFHATYTNSSDYGREAIFDGKTLFLRPRYQRFHGRAPESPDEPLALRDSYAEAVFATWDLLAPAAELTDAGAAQVAGRAGRKVVIKLSPSPRTPPTEALTQRKWREKRTIETASGEIILDGESGFPLAAKLSGTVSFMRDGRRFKMNVTLDASVSGIGTPVAIANPAADQVVATPERLREVDDRDFLLQGIAPPSRRNPDGTPVPPAPRVFDSGQVPTPVQGPAPEAASDAKPDEEPKKKKRRKKHDDEGSNTPPPPAE